MSERTRATLSAASFARDNRGPILGADGERKPTPEDPFRRAPEF